MGTVFQLMGIIIFSFSAISAQTSNIEKSSEPIKVTFYSGPNKVTGLLYIPDGTKDSHWPGVVMAPGFSGVKECNYQFFASDFASRGLAVLLFDYPNFGESEGLPRQEADPWVQVNAYRDAISFISARTEIDADKIGIWGGSYSGGHAMAAASLDPRIKCVVAMTPFVSGGFYVEHMSAQAKASLNNMFETDRKNRIEGKEPIYIPVASDKEKDFAAIPGINTWNFIQSFKSYAPLFENRISLKSLEMQLKYEPGLLLERYGTAPILVIIAKEDDIIPEKLILEAYEKLPQPKKMDYLNGHHFSPYMEEREAASGMAADWFLQHLK